MDFKIYFPLNEAKEVLLQRRSDSELVRKIQEELGERFIPIFREEPLSISFRQLCSPDNGLKAFRENSKKLDLTPVILEYHQDIFVHFNEEKKGLGRLRLVLNDGTPVVVDVINFFDNEKKKLNAVTLKDGQNLLKFHHSLFDIAGYTDVKLFDNSAWFKAFDNASEYYYYLLLHFVCHGVLSETFILDPEDSEGEFTRSIVIPALERIYQKFGLVPLIIQQYPDVQTKKEDFYWWCYPEKVNDYLIQYAKEKKLVFKPISLID